MPAQELVASGPRSPGMPRRLGSRVESAASSILGLLLLLSAPFALVQALTWNDPLLAVRPIPWIAVALLGSTATAMLWLGALAGHHMRQRREPPPGWALSAVLALILVAGPALVMLVAGTVVINLAVGSDVSVSRTPTEATLIAGDVFRQLLWDCAAAIPVLDIPETIGWEEPITDPDAPMGIASLTVRAVFTLVTVWAVRQVWLTRHK